MKGDDRTPLHQIGLTNGSPGGDGEHEIQRTTCCIVGGGPAGVVLAYLLARRGVPVTLLEEHQDFDRDFRGDTLHSSVLEIMDELGLADRLLALPHAKLENLTLRTDNAVLTVADFSHLKTRFPYITLMHQARFLSFIAGEAARYPTFRLVFGANVRELVEESGEVRGVCYQTAEGRVEIRASLTVGCDGRFSRVRQLAGLTPVKTSPPMDVLWFRLSRRPDDPTGGASGRFACGTLIGLFERNDAWQVGYVIPKGSYQQLRARGIESLRAVVADLLPEVADRVDELRDWSQVSLLSVESSRLRRWYRPGLLLIGDAAHVMSPIGGVGINYAIQDAVVAANVLVPRFRADGPWLVDLAEVQRRREWPTRVIQAFQTMVQNQVFAPALRGDKTFTGSPLMHLFTHLPIVRDLTAKLIAFGVRPVHVEGVPKAIQQASL